MFEDELKAEGGPLDEGVLVEIPDDAMTAAVLGDTPDDDVELGLSGGGEVVLLGMVLD